MKHLTRLARQAQSGFTMIELLVVIAILGILAVAVLSAINPIEQINRGRDTGSQSDAEQLLSAIDRFHAFQGYYPWQSGVNDETNKEIDDLTAVDDAWVATDISADCAVLEVLTEGDTVASANCIGSDELKSTFANRITQSAYNSLFVYYRGANNGDSTYICFAPQSGAFERAATVRCDEGYPNDLDAADVAVICDPSERVIDGVTVDAPLTCLP